MKENKNKHTYIVSDDFQAWWETQCEEPYEATMEKLMAWRAWEESARRKVCERLSKQTDLIQ